MSRTEDNIDERLLSKENQEKYLAILTLRIEENRNSGRRILNSLILVSAVFCLFITNEISEIIFGPVAIKDQEIIICILPTVFFWLLYKYILLMSDLLYQSGAYSILISKIFDWDRDLESNSLQEYLIPFSIINSVTKLNINPKGKKFIFEKTGKFLDSMLVWFWLPLFLILILIPFAFEFFMLYSLYHKFGLNTTFNCIFFFLPCFIFIFTLILIIRVIWIDQVS